jgi:diguanylate cyclase (GGDEF)-like protein/PAS domain S-box-containing protein
MIFLFAGVILHLAMATLAYYYIDRSEKLLYTQAFAQLQSVTDLKHKNLEFYFDYLIRDITSLAQAEASKMFARDMNSYLQRTDDATNTPSAFHAIIEQHQRQLNHLETLVENQRFIDLLIVGNDDHGTLFYSVKTPDLITRSVSAATPEANTLSGLWQKVCASGDTHLADIHLSDFYPEELPAMMIGTPIADNGSPIAVLIMVLPATTANEIMHYRSGMGESGESYAVGSDLLLRSDSYLRKRFTVNSSFKDPMAHVISTAAVRRALNGQAGTDIIKDYRRIDVLSAYRPFHADGITWAIISEIDAAEISDQFDAIRQETLFTSAAIALVLTILGFMLMRSIIDITVITPLEKSYTRAKSFQDILEQSLNEIFIFHKTSLRFIYINEGARRNTGYTLEEIQQMTPIDIKPRFDKVQFTQLIQPLIARDVEQLTIETVHMRKDHSIYDVDIRLQLMPFEGEECFIAIINDITERNRAVHEKELYYERSTHDYLTQLYNRHYFDELFEIEVERAKRYEHPLSLILFDIDDFKKVNDTFGHETGDAVLIELTKLITAAIRDSDICARWGGEEFIILMPHTSKEQAIIKANHLRNLISNHVFAKVDVITCSFGICEITDFDHAFRAFSQADEALYEAKSQGKNRVIQL